MWLHFSSDIWTLYILAGYWFSNKLDSVLKIDTNICREMLTFSGMSLIDFLHVDAQQPYDGQLENNQIRTWR